MIHSAGPYLLASVLVALGVYGILARRHAVLVLVGAELVLAGGGLLLVTAGALGNDATWSGQVLTLFVITIAAAEVVIALAVIVAAYRRRGHIDLAQDAE
ncbi:NADH-quinone oxidoreductase subunit NuoK [Janibacter sp. G349]|jgi:NADH-quinone oxidoreductase subunit K|uniref:NADH-quinone oxidoreductase subunit NuoK n=1 Tax=Janibacter sp. G349 TaxID=3405424 RepID=UPI003B791995